MAIYFYKNYSSLEDWIEKTKNDLGEDFQNISKKNIKVGNLDALKITFNGTFVGSGRPQIIFYQNGIVYTVNQLFEGVPQNSCQNIFDQILSSFRFMYPVM